MVEVARNPCISTHLFILQESLYQKYIFLPYLNFKTSFFVRIHNGARYDFISSQASQDPWMNSFGN